MAALAARHPRLRFQVFLASEHANQAFCTLVRELPNISLAGFWWHNLFPGIIRKVMADRLDMVAANRQVGFFSDAYCLDWTYAKAVIIRRQLAEVLAQKVSQGQYDVDEALAIARQILYESPQSLNGSACHSERVNHEHSLQRAFSEESALCSTGFFAENESATGVSGPTRSRYA